MKPFTSLAIVVFALICIMHVLRVVLGWNAIVNGTSIPTWASIVAAIVSGLLAIMVWRENK
jgi:hypothetical protein